MENKTEQNCLISVIVPVYNILDCLERCVNSICAQTWKNLEILLVDDGSTDGTGKLCDLLAEKDDRIRVFHKPNEGCHGLHQCAWNQHGKGKMDRVCGQRRLDRAADV